MSHASDHQKLMLQTEYMRAINEADDLRDDLGQYTKAALPFLLIAARVQKELSEITCGSVSGDHEHSAMQLLRTVREARIRLGMDVMTETQTVCDTSESSMAGSQKQNGNPPARTADAVIHSELPEGFSIDMFVLEPTQNAPDIEDLERTQPELARLIRNRVEGRRKERELFPKLKDLPNEDDFPAPLFLYGPPGSGKSYAMRALASYVKRLYPGDRSVVLNASALMVTSKYVGTSGHILRALFTEAEKYEFAVIILDEFEVLAASRSGDDNKVSRTNDLLELMDGVNGKTHVMVIGATNYPEKVDSAIFSRFRECVFLDSPNKETILQYLTEKPSRWHFFGSTLEEAMPALNDLAAECARRRYSFRNLEALVTLQLENAQSEKMYSRYPKGNPDIEYRPCLEEEDVRKSLARVFSDNDETRRYAYKEFQKRHGN